MEKAVYKRHIENHSTHWWFQARKQIIEKIIKNKFKKKINILDFGSGSGVNIKMLSKFGFVNIYEPHELTNKYLKEKFNNKNKYKILKDLDNSKFDLIVMADVLEHIKNDKKIIKKLSKNLNKEGHILLTVPAYNFLFSKKDEILGHFRRYKKREIKEIFYRYKALKLSYFNFFLFLPISFFILINKVLNADFIDQVEKPPKPLINKIMFNIFKIEKEILKHFNFPFGISIIGLFKKND